MKKLAKKCFSETKRRVVVTGMGMVSPLGINLEENWENMKQGRSGIRDLSKEAYGKDLPSNCKLGGTIPYNFDGKKFRTLGTDNLLTQMTLSAAEEAISDAKYRIQDFKETNLKYRTGVYVGSSLPSISCITDSIRKAYANDFTHINRMLMLRMLTNLLASNISIKYDLRGPLISPTLACATSLNAIGESFRLIKHDEADVMICGGSENSVHPLVFHSMSKLNTLYSSNKKYPPSECSRPFDADRAGFVIGEGSGVLVLEELSHAVKRNANIYCEVSGYGTFGDAYHLTKPTSDGEGGFRAMAKCLIESETNPKDIQFINAHATSTEVGDLSELNALKNMFGNRKYEEFNYFKEKMRNHEFEFSLRDEELNPSRLKQLIINCNKTLIGHLLGAAGSVESILAILSMKYNTPIDNLNTINPISDKFNFRYDTSKQYNIDNCLKNSFAFGGVNTSVLYKKLQNY